MFCGRLRFLASLQIPFLDTKWHIYLLFQREQETLQVLGLLPVHSPVELERRGPRTKGSSELIESGLNLSVSIFIFVSVLRLSPFYFFLCLFLFFIVKGLLRFPHQKARCFDRVAKRMRVEVKNMKSKQSTVKKITRGREKKKRKR